VFAEAQTRVAHFLGSAPGEGSGKVVIEKVGDWGDLTAFGIPESMITSSYSQSAIEASVERIFGISHFKSFIAEFELGEYDYLLVNTAGVYAVRGAVTDVLAPYVRCVTSVTANGRIGFKQKTGYGIHTGSFEPVLKKKMWDAEKVVGVRAANPDAWTLSIDDYPTLVDSNDGIEHKFWRRVQLEYQQQVVHLDSLTLDEGSYSPDSEILRKMSVPSLTTGSDSLTTFTCAGRTAISGWGVFGLTINETIYSAKKMGPAIVPLGDVLVGRWPTGYPTKGLCYTALPSVAKEIYTFYGSHALAHQDGFRIVALQHTKLRVSILSREVNKLLGFKANADNLPASDKAALENAEAAAGTDHDHLLFYTEYADPVTLTKDCVYGTKLYAKFSDLSGFMSNEFVPADDINGAVTFKTAQNSVNGQLERRFFAHANNVKVAGMAPIDYEVDKVKVIIDKDGGGSYTTTLCYAANGVPVPTGSELTLGEAKVWFYYGADFELTDEVASTISEVDKVSYMFRVLYGKSTDELRAEVGEAPPTNEYELRLEKGMDDLGFFDWGVTQAKDRADVSLLIAGVPINAKLAVQMKRMLAVNMGSAGINQSVFLGVRELAQQGS
jgi:hypothetical protein